MSEEGQLFDKKSLRVLQDGVHGLRELAADCVAMANASGGRLAIGMEDHADHPPPGQRIADDQVMRLNKVCVRPSHLEAGRRGGKDRVHVT